MLEITETIIDSNKSIDEIAKPEIEIGNRYLLTPKDLYKHCDIEQFLFEHTGELPDLTEIIGQERALGAMKFGFGIKRDGYNLFAFGSPEIAMQSIIRTILEAKAVQEPAPYDWCYVDNFRAMNKPRALKLPPGQAPILRHDIESLVLELCAAIPAVFESKDYHTRKQIIEEEFNSRRNKAFDELRKESTYKNLEMIDSPTGIIIGPKMNGELISPAEFDKLPATEQQQIEADVKIIQDELNAVMQQLPSWQSENREKLDELDREITRSAVSHLIEKLQQKYTDIPVVVDHLRALQQDVIDNVDNILNLESEEETEDKKEDRSNHISHIRFLDDSPILRRYEVNVMVTNNGEIGAPIIYEDNPTFVKLLGTMEQVSYMGTLVTDFNLIKPGALHLANGGYLLIDARKLLLQPYAWEGLKRALIANEIVIESLEHMHSLVTTVSLEPDAIPLNVKIILIGEPSLYYLLYELDPEFCELFKVMVDFAERMDRNDDNNMLYAKLIGKLARKEELRPLDRSAVARVIEYSARLVEDAEKLSTHMRTIADLLREADYWANEVNRSVIGADDIEKALDNQIYRANRWHETINEEIERNTILIDTAGAKIGHINGLAVTSLGNFHFGHPTRITASVRFGKGEVIDIEREAKLGGPIHSKGIFIISGYLGSHYAIDRPLSFAASLVFEQSYGGIEGDSASSAELYVLLSALANVPIKQSLAVTGSVNQYGEIQVIGGVNEKIEGFFDLCKLRGLDGQQGVLIPAGNIKHLMLRKDVVAAVKDGKFRIYAVNYIDEGIEILTGMLAGKRDSRGKFPAGSINQKVEARLLELSKHKHKQK